MNYDVNYEHKIYDYLSTYKLKQLENDWNLNTLKLHEIIQKNNELD